MCVQPPDSLPPDIPATQSCQLTRVGSSAPTPPSLNPARRWNPSAMTDLKTIRSLAAELERLSARPDADGDFIAYPQPRSIAAELFKLEQQLGIPSALRYHNRDNA